jgi:hypothetical protein
MVDTQAKCQHVFTSAITYVVIESKVVVSIVISSSPRSDFVDLIGKSQDCVSKNRSHRRQTFRSRGQGAEVSFSRNQIATEREN